MTVAAPRRAAVLGHPVAHSLSPVLHRAAYAALGLDGWRYDAVDVTEDELPEFVRGLDPSWTGLSLTMPLKQTVIPLLDHVEPLAQVVGAVNTVLFQGRTLVGANTDVHGIVAALALDRPVTSAAVLGAGATASSSLAALAQLGCTSPVVYVRAIARAGALMRAAHRMGVTPVYRTLDVAPQELGGAEVVISTLPPHAADPLAGDLTHVAGVLLDVAYDPRPTALSVAWAAAGGAAVGGEQMLLHQAAEQVRLMTGHPAPLAAMSAALEDKLTS
ncbi:shikimate dehydrogenase [Cellulomonas fengjieae]|uniref:Shikimate dehydrogenase n=1 Tax=Cellulomonas fengjieae TaxID=2819978 RepID=A0ABS3SIF5_9CELL|nr:shikimate dehydrogenase [Cellulomonas fengjieae]MBO3085539.1 shikimate dehydrogenase [Cellulomonas fengjieae]QVI64421.1 shikimate dehydrogenase [Cellulomonas fengjieae]